MTLATHGLAIAVGLGVTLAIYRLLGVDQMATVFKKKELKDKYDYIIGKLLLLDCTEHRIGTTVPAAESDAIPWVRCRGSPQKILKTYT